MSATISTGWIDETEPVFRRALDPYRSKGCVYLTGAEVTRAADGRVGSRGVFRIDGSSYIDDTGHFNAAEFVICYNQLMYVTLAVSVHRALLPEFAAWTLDDYWARQLPDVLIHKLASTYTRPIDAGSFRGEFAVAGVGVRALSRGMLTLDTTVRFDDDHAGRAHGRVGLVLTNVPGHRDE
ncbi:FcoT family thioesterase [Microbacterium sp.]|uniref:FcoT family thioesterase n=1 Tax=Microbacterium sp. TaxID=51671 RepID=UPI003A8B8460